MQKILGLCLALALSTQATAGETKSPITVPKPADMATRIDAMIETQQRTASVTPAPLVSDVGFLRRVSLDLRGSPPTPEELRAFLADEAPDKRGRLIRAFLADSGYASHWADIWRRALVGKAGTSRRFVAPIFGQWMQSELAANRPYDQLVRTMLTAEGSINEQPETAYLLRYEGKPFEAASASARQFMGVQIQCAQCHDHPYTGATQRDFLGMAGYFGRMAMQVKRNRMAKDKKKRRTFSIVERPRGLLKVNANLEPVKPKDWGRSISPSFIVESGSADLKKDGYRGTYAQLLTSPKNPLFSRMAVNRLWAMMFGRGLIEPMEDLQNGEGIHPELLDELADKFVAAGHDLKWLLESIARSRAYQRDSRLPAGQLDPAAVAKKTMEAGDAEARELAAQAAAAERLHFARAELRPLAPEQIFRSVLTATGLEKLALLRKRPQFARRKRFILRQFVLTFDTEIEGNVEEFSGTIPQSLLMMNGKFVNKALELRAGAVARIMREESEANRRISRLFICVLARSPSKAELASYRAFIKSAGNDRKAYEDLAWVLMNSTEFLFNH